jgi:hypothetical protein
MSWTLVSAAILITGVGLAHSWLGEQFIIRRLLRRADLPKLFGDDSFTRQTLRFAWHLTTLAWLGLAAVLLVLSGLLPAVRVADGVIFAIAATFIASALAAVVFTRARHLSWLAFALIAALCLITLR